MNIRKTRVVRAEEKIDGYTSFTGTDIRAYAYMPYLAAPVELGALSFIDMSTQRVKAMVTSLGRASGRGFTRGARVVSGVMSFIQLDRSPFRPLHDITIRNSVSNYGLANYADELPPFNLVLTYIDEEGNASYRVIEGIEIVQEQFRDSIDDVNPQNVFSFVALHVTPLTPFRENKPVESIKKPLLQEGPLVTPPKKLTTPPKGRNKPSLLPVIETLKGMLDLLHYKGPETSTFDNNKKLGQLANIIALEQMLSILHHPVRPPIK